MPMYEHARSCMTIYERPHVIRHHHVWILSLNNHIRLCMIIHDCIWSCIIVYPMKTSTWNPRSFYMDIIQVESTWAKSNILKIHFSQKKKFLSQEYFFGNFQAVTHPTRDPGERCLTSKIAANWSLRDEL